MKKLAKTLAFFFLIGYNKQAVVERVNLMCATVAQSVEQLIRNQQVAGSSPASSSKNTTLPGGVFYCISSIRRSAAIIACSRTASLSPKK